MKEQSYFSIRIRASTATTAFGVAKSGTRPGNTSFSTSTKTPPKPQSTTLSLLAITMPSLYLKQDYWVSLSYSVPIP